MSKTFNYHKIINLCLHHFIFHSLTTEPLIADQWKYSWCRHIIVDVAISTPRDKAPLGCSLLKKIKKIKKNSPHVAPSIRVLEAHQRLASYSCNIQAFIFYIPTLWVPVLRRVIYQTPPHNDDSIYITYQDDKLYRIPFRHNYNSSTHQIWRALLRLFCNSR